MKRRQEKERERRTCKVCEKLFVPIKRQIYCSADCRKQRPSLQPRKCHNPNCDREFSPKRKDAIYCTDLCGSQVRLIRRKPLQVEENLSDIRKPLELRECANCGQPFQQKRWWQKHCSSLCGSRMRQQRLIQRKALEFINQDLITGR